MPYPTHCPSCGSKYIKFMGAGTEKVEQECNKLFPGVPVLRMLIIIFSQPLQRERLKYLSALK